MGNFQPLQVIMKYQIFLENLFNYKHFQQISCYAFQWIIISETKK